jgi:uncharacterized membrane protein
MMTIGEPAQTSTLIAVDAPGSSVHTSQVRLFLNVSLAGTAPAATVTLPLYLEIGYGTAQLAGLSCNALNASSTTATLNVTPGLVNGWIGQVTAAQMLNFSNAPIVTPGLLVSLPLLGVTVTGAANATVGNITPVAVQFSDTQIQNGTIQTSSTTDFVASLLQGLFTNTTLQVSGVPIPGLPQTTMTVLNGAAAPLDQLISGVLQTTGVSLGQASTWIDGARCGAAILAG